MTSIVAYEERGVPLASVRAPASLTVPLVIGFADPFRIALGRSASDGDSRESFAAGLHAGFVDMSSSGHASCIQVDFTPVGARRYFAMPMSEIASTMAPLDFERRLGLDDLRQRLGDARCWSERLDIIERAIAARLADGPSPCPSTIHAYGRILEQHGNLQIRDVASELGWSRKRMAAAFHDQIGIPAKSVARIARFARAASLAGGADAGSWADIAYETGHSDQAHLVREFAALAGRSPAAWLAAQAGN